MVSQLKALRTVKLENEDRRIKVFLAKEAQYRRGAHNILARYTRTHPLSPPSPSHPTPPSPLPLTPHPSPLTPHPSPPPGGAARAAAAGQLAHLEARTVLLHLQCE